MGYIPNLYLLSKSENKYKLDSKEKLRLYHEILDCIMASLVTLMEGDGFPFSFMYKGKKYNVILKFTILVILGDTEGHDRLCA